MILKSLEEDVHSKIVSIVNKGKLKESIENLEEAIVFYNQALEIYPKDENEYFGQKYLYELFGNCFERQENLDEAVKYFEKASQCYEGLKDKNLLLKISILYSQLNNEELSKHYADLCIKQGGRKLVKESPSLNSLFEDEMQTQNEIVVPKIYKVIDGKEYTFEQLKVYENEQWKIYQEKKNKKLFGLF